MLKRTLYFCLFSVLHFASFEGYGSDSEVFRCVYQQNVQALTSDRDLVNPAAPGNFNYRIVSYGESASVFALSKPDIDSPTVDLPHFLADYSRNQGYEHDAYHKFKSVDLALNAKVWIPSAKEPLPLVLLVHGNSPPGFDYLGELFASRGHVVVQVDQTYLNDLWGENGARAWILLEHLKLLRKWNAQRDQIFYNRLDMEKIALIGMSRGGEAVALAGAFNQLETIPETDQPTDFNFNIKSVVALAPMDGQYQHAHGSNILRNTNYLVLQGGHDADVYQFLGSQQWRRTHFDNEKNFLKHSIYIYRGNHVNFNQDMSDDFRWGGRKRFYSKLLKPLEQEQLTKVFVSAFLEATLAGKKQYIEMLRRPDADQFGLPDDIYITQYMNSDFKVIEDFDDPSEVTQKVAVEANGKLREMAADIIFERLRGNVKAPNKMLKMVLDKQHKTTLRIKLTALDFTMPSEKGLPTLTFSMARTDSGRDSECQAYNLFTEARLELLVNKELVFSQELGAKYSLPPLLASDFSELESDDFRFAPTQPVLQTYRTPIKLNKSFSTDSELELVLIFEPSMDMSVVIDDIGITSETY